MSALTVDSGVASYADLLGLLPPDVRPLIVPGLLEDAGNAAALRLLATIRNDVWAQHLAVSADAKYIDWDGLVNLWARRHLPANSTVRLRVELAASLAGWAGARPELYEAASWLDAAGFEALLDALRIAREGLTP